MCILGRGLNRHDDHRHHHEHGHQRRFHRREPPGSLCNGQQDQCDMMGLCVDCVDNGGCSECCYCAGGICIPG
ncbi:hypothetical protein [Nannocystis bainbridge]|uniref:Uncharacterized protein n=1 Tax=Nannocystis bainbridge TaxID=2995303 RepID=A0ABT5DZQ3_9BACT|nr:hypothetical protein [Nannocystis bainbridge]MDC0719099.1 hypothetical protein [Nannocystis bainbridge]